MTYMGDDGGEFQYFLRDDGTVVGNVYYGLLVMMQYDDDVYEVDHVNGDCEIQAPSVWDCVDRLLWANSNGELTGGQKDGHLIVPISLWDMVVADQKKRLESSFQVLVEREVRFI